MSTNLQNGLREVESRNCRILTIDDNAAIHEDYRKVLLQRESNSDLDEAAAFLFGEGESVASTRENLEQHYEIDSAFQGEQGLKLVQQSLEEDKPYAVAFIDVRMPPGWDGIETAHQIWKVDPDLPIVLCTAYADYSWEQISDRLSRTDQLLILKKPFDPIELRQIAASQIARWHLNKTTHRNQEILEELVAQRTKEIATTRDLVFISLARLAESRDPETGEHLDRIQAYTRILAEHLASRNEDGYRLDPRTIDTIVRSSLLHDIGKVGIPDSILLKPGRLTPDEFEIMKTHSEIGAEALEDASSKSSCSEFLKTASEIARHHHERFDGSGYPTGLAGLNIPLSARIVAVADVFDALTSVRVYKSAMTPLDARALIETQSGKHFDPMVISAFSATWKQFMQLAAESHASFQQEQEEFEEAETIISSVRAVTSGAGAVSMTSSTAEVFSNAANS